MNRLRLFGIAVLAVFAVGIAVASSASASLPTILFLPGQTSLLLVGSKAGANVAHFGSKALQIEAEEIKVELTALTNNTHLGKILFLFLKSKAAGGETCQTEGLGAGDVHVTGEWHLVYTGLGASLNVGLLILVTPPTKFICGEAKLTTEGSVLTTVNEGTKGTEEDITEATSAAECEGASNEKAKHPKYENEAGTTVEASLLGVIAGIKEKECESISGNITLKAVTGQMFKIDL